MIKPRVPARTGPSPSSEDDRGSVTRRGVLSSALAMLLSGSLAGHYLAGLARAHAAVTELSVAGDTLTTDNGQLTGLTASVGGHISYDGLDTEANTVNVELYAAPSGGDMSGAGNRIATTSIGVADQADLDTHAGHYDFSFVGADVLSADDLSKGDFSATGDGTTKDTDVDFRITLIVDDIDGTSLVTADATTTATISVTNEPNSANAQGNGDTDAQGTNQSP